MVTKKVLRKVYLEKRLFLSKNEYLLRNRALVQVLFESFDFSKLSVVHTFLPIAKQKEVNTHAIIDKLRVEYPHVKIATSCTHDDGSLSHYQIDSNTTFKTGKWGISEPVDAKGIDIQSIDLVLVPLIIFDKTGHRIGYGKGYYDRFLSQIPQSIKLGLALGPPLDAINFVEDTDIKMNTCATPFMFYRF